MTKQDKAALARARKELGELEVRILKAKEKIDHAKDCGGSLKDYLLLSQFNAMVTYKTILSLRIQLWGE
jgi:hypothetical protein